VLETVTSIAQCENI